MQSDDAKPEATVFICGQRNMVKVQLDLPKWTLERFKEMAKKIPGATPKGLMERIIGASAGIKEMQDEK